MYVHEHTIGCAQTGYPPLPQETDSNKMCINENWLLPDDQQVAATCGTIPSDKSHGLRTNSEFIKPESHGLRPNTGISIWQCWRARAA